MSVAATSTSDPAGATSTSAVQAQAARPRVDTACPLCGAPLAVDQEWCLGCGAAARTRLATATSWKAPILVLALVVALALGALAASLVSLIGKSGSTAPPPAVTRTIASQPLGIGGAAGSGTGTAASPGTGLGGVTTPATTGAANPGTPTTISPSNSPSSTGTSTTPGATASSPSTGGGRLSRAAEQALSKAGFVPRGGK